MFFANNTAWGGSRASQEKSPVPFTAGTSLVHFRKSNPIFNTDVEKPGGFRFATHC